MLNRGCICSSCRRCIICSCCRSCRLGCIHGRGYACGWHTSRTRGRISDRHHRLSLRHRAYRGLHYRSGGRQTFLRIVLGGCIQYGKHIHSIGNLYASVKYAQTTAHRDTCAHLHARYLAQSLIESRKPCTLAYNDNPLRELFGSESGIFHLLAYIHNDLSRTRRYIVVDSHKVRLTGSVVSLKSGKRRSSSLLHLLSLLLNEIQSRDVACDITRSHRKHHQMYKHTILVYRHSGGLCSEIHKHTAQTLFLLHKHKISNGERTHECIHHLELQAVLDHHGKIAQRLVAAAYDVELSQDMRPDLAKGFGCESIVDIQLPPGHSDDMTVSERIVKSLAEDIFKYLLGDNRVRSKPALYSGSLRRERTAADTEVYAFNLARRLAQFQAIDHLSHCLCGFYDVAHTSVAHYVRDRLSFNCLHIDCSVRTYRTGGSFDLGTAYFKGYDYLFFHGGLGSVGLLFLKVIKVAGLL